MTDRQDLSPQLLGEQWPAHLPFPVTAERVAGGWVATTWSVRLADGTQAMVKRTPFPAEIEADGLAALAGSGVPVPPVLGHQGCTLVTQRVAGTANWAGLGRAIAGMHQVGSENYGWHRNNRAGRFVQTNAWSKDWPTFFVDQRVRTHLADRAIPPELRHRLEAACDGPIQALLPNRPRASLTHGDLWSGNIIDGRWVVDPEVSYADRELDLAYMQMPKSMPLPDEFWSAYTEVLPLPEGHEQRRGVLELHHRLLEVRHFGQRALIDLNKLLAEHGW